VFAQASRCSSSSASTAAINSPSASMASRAWSSGLFAFHSSQTGRITSMPGAGSPARPASRMNLKNNDPLPRCESTWAIDHSVSYDCWRTCSGVSGVTVSTSRARELRSAASTTSADGVVLGSAISAPLDS
jgi:hypothetical protein